MSTEEFQGFVLQELKGLREDQEGMKKDLKSVIQQTPNLTEFKEEVNNKLDIMLDEINTLEMIVSKNWQDITRLKAAR